MGGGIRGGMGFSLRPRHRPFNPGASTGAFDLKPTYAALESGHSRRSERQPKLAPSRQRRCPTDLLLNYLVRSQQQRVWNRNANLTSSSRI